MREAPDELIIDAALVHRLLKRQFPQWADLPLRPVFSGGWDNRTFRLGETMSVRLPSALCYAPQVLKEHRWLPKLAPMLPLAIPVPLEIGQPAGFYPWNWSIYAWLPGEPAGQEVSNADDFARALAEFLLALQRIDPTGGPSPGTHNFYRGGPLITYDAEVRHAISALGGSVHGEAAAEAWGESLAARSDKKPVWLHGDISPGNLLIEEGRLSAVIDFGSSGVGDPACDFAIAWSFLGRRLRASFRSALGVGQDSWLRARGWALWKALIVLAGREQDPFAIAGASRTVEEVLADAAVS